MSTTTRDSMGTITGSTLPLPPTSRARALSKSFMSRVIIGVTPFRVLITLLITYLLSPLPLHVNPKP